MVTFYGFVSPHAVFYTNATCFKATHFSIVDGKGSSEEGKMGDGNFLKGGGWGLRHFPSTATQSLQTESGISC